MATGSKIQGLILDSIDFQNDALLAAVESLATASAALGRSGDNFDDVNAGDQQDASEIVGVGILEMADLFSEIGGDKRETAKAAFGKLFTAATPEQKAAGERLFSDALDLQIAAKTIKAVADGLLPDAV
jgi:hypothetical protein